MQRMGNAMDQALESVAEKMSWKTGAAAQCQQVKLANPPTLRNEMVGGFFNNPMGLTKVLSGEVEPHPCRSPPRGAIPVFACVRQESGFSPGHNAHKSILLLWHIPILTKLQKSGCKTIAAVLYMVETQACIHFMKGIQHGWGGWFCENLYYKQHRNR